MTQTEADRIFSYIEPFVGQLTDGGFDALLVIGVRAIRGYNVRLCGEASCDFRKQIGARLYYEATGREVSATAGSN